MDEIRLNRKTADAILEKIDYLDSSNLIYAHKIREYINSLVSEDAVEYSHLYGESGLFVFPKKVEVEITLRMMSEFATGKIYQEEELKALNDCCKWLHQRDVHGN